MLCKKLTQKCNFDTIWKQIVKTYYFIKINIYNMLN